MQRDEHQAETHTHPFTHADTQPYALARGYARRDAGVRVERARATRDIADSDIHQRRMRPVTARRNDNDDDDGPPPPRPPSPSPRASP